MASGRDRSNDADEPRARAPLFLLLIEWAGLLPIVIGGSGGSGMTSQQGGAGLLLFAANGDGSVEGGSGGSLCVCVGSEAGRKGRGNDEEGPPIAPPPPYPVVTVSEVHRLAKGIAGVASLACLFVGGRKERS